MASGWKGESQRHSMASKGIKTGQKKSVKKINLTNDLKERRNILYSKLERLPHDKQMVYMDTGAHYSMVNSMLGYIIRRYGSYSNLEDKARSGNEEAKIELANYTKELNDSVDSYSKFKSVMDDDFDTVFLNYQQFENPYAYRVIPSKYQNEEDGKKSYKELDDEWC